MGEAQVAKHTGHSSWSFLASICLSRSSITGSPVYIKDEDKVKDEDEEMDKVLEQGKVRERV